MNAIPLSYAVVILSFGCCLNATAATLRDRLPGPKVAAHRGAMQADQENSLEAFRAASVDNVDILEMDLRITRDGVPVVFHDRTLSRVTGCRGKIADKTLNDLRRCTNKTSGYAIPTFEEVLIMVAGQKIINVEFKDFDVIAPALDLVRKYDAYEWAYFQTRTHVSFYNKVRGLDARIAIIHQATNLRELDWILNQADPQLMLVEIPPVMATAQVVARIRSAGKFSSMSSWPLSPNEERHEAVCEQVWNLGLDIAVTNANRSCVKQRLILFPPQF